MRLTTCVAMTLYMYMYTKYWDMVHTSASLLASDLSDNLFDVQNELNPVAVKWKSIGASLRLKSDTLKSIDARCSDDIYACLSGMVTEWLKRNYDVGKFGQPTWQKLVEVVVHPSGGANTALAMAIARRHKAGGMLSDHV